MVVPEVSAIVSPTSSSEYSSKSENRLNSSDLDSSRLSVLRSFLDDQNSLGWAQLKENTIWKSNAKIPCSVSISDIYSPLFNGSEYAILIFLNEYAVLDKKVGYAVSNGSGYAVSVLAQIRCIFLDGYGVLVVRTVIFILFPLWSFVECRHRYAVSSLMDTVYWMSEQ
ncbi:hypothetical protein Tco_1057930 [Tanacetum coccineum]|uniref:Uncharacterized protein n=1 Tax=Tanacetum coccineum TaxID=301880 RepID=A0ABQ5H8W0_9ASTR